MSSDYIEGNYSLGNHTYRSPRRLRPISRNSRDACLAYSLVTKFKLVGGLKVSNSPGETVMHGPDAEPLLSLGFGLGMLVMLPDFLGSAFVHHTSLGIHIAPLSVHMGAFGNVRMAPLSVHVGPF
eukprot:7632989-Pyramimonas_sp.AAC.1